MKEYRVKKGIRILIYISASLGILFYGAFIIDILSPSGTITQSGEEKLWLPPLFMLMIVLMIVAIISTKKRRVIITDESICIIGFLKKRELKFTEIKGFKTRTNPKIRQLEDIVVEPIDRSKKTIVFKNTIENSSEIKAILASKVIDFDKGKREATDKIIEDEKQEILSNQEFGISSKEREDQLKKARLTSYVLTGVGIFVTFWTIFFPNPYEYAIIACIAVPLITLAVIKFWKGLIRVDGAKNSVYPNATYPLIAPGIALSFRMSLDFSIDDYSNVWIPAIAIAITYTGILLSFSKHLSFKKGKDLFSILWFAIFSFVYGFGTVIATNCVFDKSDPQMFSSEVVNKEMREDKVTSYYLYLLPWNNKTETEKVSIDSDLYDSLNEGDEVSVYLFEGRFNIPWIVVDHKR
ncbi:hypothetical protein SAMN06265349_10446 [Flavobacterium resistens]|uniref:Uncharacterized protein n=1 Tax=Flavobacterium resistens TaxID=443612 RepID=A0A521E367_9FLAO|nr:hypothetical protein [Flavobacterium resistens]MRX69267.1 hypothetical protein [Flavobacterium resistens]SMO78275.1 hypothetical protein SAMN06265349_10446 [Flavobacterium resistens]